MPTAKPRIAYCGRCTAEPRKQCVDCGKPIPDRFERCRSCNTADRL